MLYALAGFLVGFIAAKLLRPNDWREIEYLQSELTEAGNIIDMLEDDIATLKQQTGFASRYGVYDPRA